MTTQATPTPQKNGQKKAEIFLKKGSEKGEKNVGEETEDGDQEGGADTRNGEQGNGDADGGRKRQQQPILQSEGKRKRKKRTLWSLTHSIPV